ncbi:MAG: ABC transporter permease subunit [Candidatus Tectomicrobia bacterium]|uniref:ABC transporter permease subunit n=1 Tax=Tectimicrobiota bacterium TaxID=2528274 RepID=A0A937W6J3_UNCTE|nr:ABC transporter permease subunit [Candidatus Tectomicrobia bacterium]
METPSLDRSLHASRQPLLISLCLLILTLLVWQLATVRPAFQAQGLTAEQLQTLEFNGDIVRNSAGQYAYNPDKTRGIPGPWAVVRKTVEEFSQAFHKHGTNDHGIGHLIRYTVTRFAAGFLSASVVAVCLGVLIGLSRTLYQALNPFIQLLKPISPLAWMPLLLYTVQNPTLTAVCVVFLASLWPTVANTAFGVSNIRKDYLQVASLLQLSWWQRLLRVVLPAAAPAIIAGLRISFGSALVAVVPAEMLLGELGVGYLTWIEWNNLHIAGILFAILVVGAVGVTLDAGFNRLARLVTYTE